MKLKRTGITESGVSDATLTFTNIASDRLGLMLMMGLVCENADLDDLMGLAEYANRHFGELFEDIETKVETQGE